MNILTLSSLLLLRHADAKKNMTIDLTSSLEYTRKHAVRLLRLREQHTPPRSVVVIVVSLQLMHFLIHASWWKVN